MLLIGMFALTLAGCAGGGEEKTAPQPPPPPAVGGTCTDVPRPKPKESGGIVTPTGSLNPFKDYRVVFETNCGSFTVELDLQAQSRTVLSFFRLAKRGYYDNTVVHRIVKDLLFQSGDPSATGQGGPGYSTVDAPPPNTRYTKGIVAMAKKTEDDPGTAGSQFFVVTARDAELEPDFAVVGRVTKGLDALERIGRQPTTEDEHGDPIPSKNPVVIEKARAICTPKGDGC